jgi:hypothetical protein
VLSAVPELPGFNLVIWTLLLSKHKHHDALKEEKVLFHHTIKVFDSFVAFFLQIINTNIMAKAAGLL